MTCNRRTPHNPHLDSWFPSEGPVRHEECPGVSGLIDPNWRRLLKAYMKHVGEMEGTTFLGRSADGGASLGLSAEEFAVLVALSDEVDDEHDWAGVSA